MKHHHTPSVTARTDTAQTVRKVLGWIILVAVLATGAASFIARVFAQTTAAERLPSGATSAPAPTAPAQPSGATMAHGCAACHGTLGRLGDESFMPLAGMPVRQFVTTMIDFREGRRPATLMGHVAQGFTDSEIQTMGEFFAAVPAVEPAKGTP
jgi:sulfide dehydrogenase cytochrome subunit